MVMRVDEARNDQLLGRVDRLGDTRAMIELGQSAARVEIASARPLRTAAITPSTIRMSALGGWSTSPS